MGPREQELRQGQKDPTPWGAALEEWREVHNKVGRGAGRKVGDGSRVSARNRDSQRDHGFGDTRTKKPGAESMGLYESWYKVRGKNP